MRVSNYWEGGNKTVKRDVSGVRHLLPLGLPKCQTPERHGFTPWHRYAENTSSF